MRHLLSKSIGVIKQEGITEFCKLALEDIIRFLQLPYCFFRIRTFKLSGDLEQLINFAFSLGIGHIQPDQNRSEIRNLLSIVREKKPRYILEIGTAWGGTLFLFTKIASKDARVISVDKQNRQGRGGYPIWKIPFFKSFASPGQKIYLLPTDSHAKRTLEEVKNILNGNKLDFLFIDGDHSYEGVKMDFETYSPLVRKNGLIAFHDIANKMDGPHKLLTEIKAQYKQIEIANNDTAITNTAMLELC